MNEQSPGNYSDGSKATDRIPIVAIGASAGGLEPFEQFFDSTQDKLGVAYVIIQHLSPNFHSMMDELLARHSNLAIERVIDGMKIEPDTIYLNPPRTEMIVKDGVFRLTEYSEDKQLNLPIDRFFESLAEEAGKNAIAIVLSGTGSDGTKGAAAIKDAGGTVLAQDISSAKFDGMPGSVINLGYADAVGYPSALAANISRLMKGQPLIEAPDGEENLTTRDRILRRLRERFGTEFGYYKSATINRRLERRATLRDISLEAYADLLLEDPDEAAALYADLLIEVTAFFRDAEAFEEIREKVVPVLAEKMSTGKPVRIWVPGCASGEEAYTLAIMFADYARDNGLDLHLKIMATDIHHRSLDAASAGMYPKSSLEGLTPEQVDRYFDSEGDRFQVKQVLRRIVVFSPHNLLKDPPFTRMDLISCRNVLIYFKDVAQHKTVALFHFALKASGYLFLGPSETVGTLEREFDVLDSRWRLFQKKRDVRLLESTSMLPPNGQLEAAAGAMAASSLIPTLSQLKAGASVHKHAHNETLKEMLRIYAPPGFLLNGEGEILHVFGDSGQFLNIESGAFSNKITELVDDELKLIITTGLERVKITGKLPFERRIDTETDASGPHSIVISIRPIGQFDATNPYLLLTLERVKPNVGEAPEVKVLPLEATEATRIMHTRIVDLERDLKATEESLQSTIEELETSNEELQATNEELMASNEELQSTNEELHSVNEELYTVSSEHQRKIGELIESTDDMDHLLKATDIGIIFLDDTLKVRRFTPSATKAFNLILEDNGRPFDHVTYRFKRFDMLEEIKNVRRTGTVFEREVGVDDKTFMLRILPYSASLQEIVGAVITTVDISDLKKAEQERARATKEYELIVKDITSLLVRWEAKTGQITFCSPTFSERLGLTDQDVVGTLIGSVGKKGKRTSVFSSLTRLEEDIEFENEILCYDRTGDPVYISGNVRCIRDNDNNIVGYQSTSRDVTSQFRYRQALESLLEIHDGPDDQDQNAQFDRILSVGRDYLDMPRGVISVVDGDELQVLNVQGFADNRVTIGYRRALNMSFSRHLPDESGLFKLDDLEKNPKVKKKMGHMSDTRSVIGSQALQGDPPLVLMFMDFEPRAQGFSEEEQMFIRVLSQTVEHLYERNQSLTSLQKSRAHLATVFDQSPILKCVVDRSGTVQDANLALFKVLGYEKEEVVGQDLASFLLDHDTIPVWKKLLSENASSHQEPLQTTLKSKSGAVVSTEISAIPFLSPETKEKLVLIAIVDVTERNRAFDKIERQKRELEKANEGLSTFAYIASHDLQEPLRKIQQYVEMLERDLGAKPNTEENYCFDVISGSAARMSYLVRDILAYTTASNTKVDITELDLHDVVSIVIDDLSDEMEAKSAKIKLGTLPKVQGDVSAAKLVFQNLISNGLKYQEPGHKPHLTIRAGQKKSGTVIEVVDNGIGVHEQEGKSIFDPFVRLHSKHEYSGSGIGLAICKTLCERMEWKLSHSPNPKGGTVFFLEMKGIM